MNKTSNITLPLILIYLYIPFLLFAQQTGKGFNGVSIVVLYPIFIAFTIFGLVWFEKKPRWFNGMCMVFFLLLVSAPLVV
ncbi:hypothetical protein CVD28_01835 [Bacillus sp. M6-12]|uniref:hypothetical protein n=1 Tax=Bacillus sp. M6-12 TaxID=2054166 RepID=UPI000C76F90A|nr:hypothetical protein [Bacillus sp. M6-12]PLS19172.1 hypothetical protein CVD28_01835 [Bacillus sp. M6-12]